MPPLGKGFLIAFFLLRAPAVLAQSGTEPLPYAYLADLTVSAPIVADVSVINASRLKGESAIGTPPERIRFLIEAKVNSLIRGEAGLPESVNYLVDVPEDSAGKAPRLRKARFLIVAAPVPGNPAMLRLSAPGAQLPWTEDTVSRIKGIIRDSLAPDAPPRIIGVGDAFHVPGSLPGESETQIFLKTQDNRPVSISVLRRPGEQPTWALALSELVDEAAKAPAKDTLLWYRLACSLPPALPDKSTAKLGADDAAAASEDYKFVIDSLGPCDRETRPASHL